MSARLNNLSQVPRYDDDSSSSSRKSNLKQEVKKNLRQVREYNELRRAKSTICHKSRKVYNSWEEYKAANPDNAPTWTTRRSSNSSKLNGPTSTGIEFNLVDTYRAADGTVYRHYHKDNADTIVANYPTKNVIHVPGRYHEHYRQWATFDEIPTNIKAKFGTNDTKELLKDELRVHDTLSEIYNAGINRKHQYVNNNNESNSETTTKDESGLDKSVATYYDLSNHLRHAVGRGYPTATRLSHKQDVHNLELTKAFLADMDNVDSPYRRKKDWLMKWAEANIMRQRVFKKLETLEAEKAKENSAKNE